MQPASNQPLVSFALAQTATLTLPIQTALPERAAPTTNRATMELHQMRSAQLVKFLMPKTVNALDLGLEEQLAKYFEFMT